MRPVNYAVKALLDMDEIADYIQQDSPRSAFRFLESVEKTAELLGCFPELGAVHESPEGELEGLRHTLVSGFPKYVVYYRIRQADIVVTRVLQGHRNIPEVLRE